MRNQGDLALSEGGKETRRNALVLSQFWKGLNGGEPRSQKERFAH